MKKFCILLLVALSILLITGCPAKPYPAVRQIQVQPELVNEGDVFTVGATITGVNGSTIIMVNFNGEEKLACFSENYSTCSFAAPDVSTDTEYPIEITVKDLVASYNVSSSATVVVVYVPDPEPKNPEVISFDVPPSVDEGETFTVEATVTDEDSEFFVNFIFNGDTKPGVRDSVGFDTTKVLDGKYVATFTAPEVNSDNDFPVEIQVMDAVTYEIIKMVLSVPVKDVPAPIPADPEITEFTVPPEVNEGDSFHVEATITDTDSTFHAFFTFNGEKKPALIVGNVFSANFVAPGVDSDTNMDIMVEAEDSITFNTVSETLSTLVKDIPDIIFYDPEIVSLIAPEQINEREEFTVEVTVNDPDNNSILWVYFNDREFTCPITAGQNTYQAKFIAPVVEESSEYTITAEVKDLVTGSMNSTNIIINIMDNDNPPEVTLNLPDNFMNYSQEEDFLEYSADVFDVDGNLAGVEALVRNYLGEIIYRFILPHTNNSAPADSYYLLYPDLQGCGTYTLSVIATDTLGMFSYDTKDFYVHEIPSTIVDFSVNPLEFVSPLAFAPSGTIDPVATQTSINVDATVTYDSQVTVWTSITPVDAIEPGVVNSLVSLTTPATLTMSHVNLPVDLSTLEEGNYRLWLVATVDGIVEDWISIDFWYDKEAPIFVADEITGDATGYTLTSTWTEVVPGDIDKLSNYSLTIHSIPFTSVYQSHDEIHAILTSGLITKAWLDSEGIDYSVPLEVVWIVENLYDRARLKTTHHYFDFIGPEINIELEYTDIKGTEAIVAENSNLGFRLDDSYGYLKTYTFASTDLSDLINSGKANLEYQILSTYTDDPYSCSGVGYWSPLYFISGLELPVLVIATAEDWSGNTSSAEATLLIDTWNPRIDIECSSPSATELVVTYIATDMLFDNVLVNVIAGELGTLTDQSFNTAGSFSFDLTGISTPTTVTINATAFDLAGHSTMVTDSAYYNDNVLPVLGDIFVNGQLYDPCNIPKISIETRHIFLEINMTDNGEFAGGFILPDSAYMEYTTNRQGIGTNHLKYTVDATLNADLEDNDIALIAFSAWDKVINTLLGEIKFDIDTIAPTPTITSLAPTSKETSETFDWSIVAEEGNFDRIEFSADVSGVTFNPATDTIKPGTAEVNFPSLDGATVTITANSFDIFGNTANATAQIFVDNVDPVAAVSVIDYDVGNAGAPTIIGDISDDLEIEFAPDTTEATLTVKFKMTDGTYSGRNFSDDPIYWHLNYITSIQTDILGNGLEEVYEYYFDAEFFSDERSLKIIQTPYDAFGHTTDSTLTIIAHDAVAPVINSFNFVEMSPTNSTEYLHLEWDITEKNLHSMSLSFDIDGTPTSLPFTGNASSVTITIPEIDNQTLTATLTAMDTQGNSTQATTQIVVDNKAPEVLYYEFANTIPIITEPQYSQAAYIKFSEPVLLIPGLYSGELYYIDGLGTEFLMEPLDNSKFIPVENLDPTGPGLLLPMPTNPFPTEVLIDLTGYYLQGQDIGGRPVTYLIKFRIFDMNNNLLDTEIIQYAPFPPAP